MKRIICLLSVAVLVLSCGGPSKKMVKQAEPLIEEELLKMISHPETYEAISTVYLGRGLVDKDFYIYNEDGPTGDSVAVRVFCHECTHHSRSHELLTNKICLYLTDDLKAVLAVRFEAEPDEDKIRWLK